MHTQIATLSVQKLHGQMYMAHAKILLRYRIIVKEEPLALQMHVHLEYSLMRFSMTNPCYVHVCTNASGHVSVYLDT